MFVFYNDFFNTLIGTSISEVHDEVQQIEKATLFLNKGNVVGFNIFNIDSDLFSNGLLRTSKDLETFNNLEFVKDHNLTINNIDNLKVVKIVGCEQHPKSERLKVCQVTDGSNNWQIVTNAENAHINLVTGVAIAECYTPNGIKITKGKLLNAVSEGMFLSANTTMNDEYNQEGILELNDADLGNLY